MLVPLKSRWMPPEAVIKIFESEGFIWGGYWIIFDNMHFEYHPELTESLYGRKKARGRVAWFKNTLIVVAA